MEKVPNFGWSAVTQKYFFSGSCYPNALVFNITKFFFNV